MDYLTQIRRQLAAILLHHTIVAQTAQGRLHLVEQTGLDNMVINNALTYGIVESGELVLICAALDLDAASVLAEAVNHIGSVACPLADASTLTEAQLDGRACIHCGREDTTQIVHPRKAPDGGQLFECAEHQGCRAYLPSHAENEPQPEQYPS